ncbi:MAG: RING finger domain-containing protein [Minisyncoccia bacterium]
MKKFNIVLSMLLLMAINVFAMHRDIAGEDIADDVYQKGCQAYLEKNYALAIECFTEAADKGHPFAQHELGVIYDNGEGIPVDPEKAVEWYTRAAEQEYPPALNNLGFAYGHGAGVPVDHKKSLEMYTRAARKGHATAQYNLGVIYEYGKKVAADPNQAIEFYALAADQGYALAQYKLGLFYELGAVVPIDKRKAVEFYTLAAAGGNLTAHVSLGRFYESGVVVPRDLKRALHHYAIAREGKPYAEEYLMRVRQAIEKRRPKIFDGNVHALKEDTCFICLESFVDSPESIWVFRCSHVYHVECSKTWAAEKPNFSCPGCRAEHYLE